MRTSLVSLTLLLTVLSSVGTGVLLASSTIYWILQIFAPVAREADEPMGGLQEATAQQG